MLTASSRASARVAATVEQQPQERAAARQHDALGQQLRQQTAAPGAEGGADRHFLLPCRGPRQEQVGEVGADDQHHHPDRAREHPDREPDAAADLFCERLHVALEAVAFRMLGHDLASECPDFRPRLLDRDPWLEPADHGQRIAPAIRFLAEREGEIEVEMAAGREHGREVERGR